MLGISNYITRFNNFAKSTNISTLPIHNYLYIIRNMITYNLGKTRSQPGARGFIVIAELQCLPHMNGSYIYKIYFFVMLNVLNCILDRRS